MEPLQIDIWSDVACPWCYVGKRRFEAALESLDPRPEVDVRWRSFELDPEAPPSRPVDYAERLAKKYGMPKDRSEEMIRTMTSAAAVEGIEMRFDRIQPGNTFDAHRLLHLAAESGRRDALKERLLLAYFSEGAPISESPVLTELATEVGLDETGVREVLAGDRFAEAVRADEAEAHASGIRGVPYFRIGKGAGLSGAQPPELLAHALTSALGQHPG